MKIAILPADTGACGHYRLIWPADAIRALHPDWSVRVYDPRRVRVEAVAGGVRIHGLDHEDLDVIVVQRVGLPVMARMLSWLQAQGTRVVMDMDDAMWALDPANHSYGAWNTPAAFGGARAHWSVTDKVAEMADLVTVTTSALAERYGDHGRVEVLPNRIPAMALDAHPETVRTGAPLAGWAGFMATHPHDPAVVGSAVKEAAAAGTIHAGVIGDAYKVSKRWGCKVENLPTANLGMDYYRRLAELDIGLVPLATEGSSAEFNRAKSSLKALEMAATGAAVIASPTPANIEFAMEVPIALAETPEEWLGHIGRLADPVARAEQVEKQTAAILANGWILQDRAADWACAWTGKATT